MVYNLLCWLPCILYLVDNSVIHHLFVSASSLSIQFEPMLHAAKQTTRSSLTSQCSTITNSVQMSFLSDQNDQSQNQWGLKLGRYLAIMSTTQIFNVFILFCFSMCNRFNDSNSEFSFHTHQQRWPSHIRWLEETDLQAVPSGYILIKYPKCNHRKWRKENIIERQKPVVVCSLSREWCIHLI